MSEPVLDSEQIDRPLTPAELDNATSKIDMIMSQALGNNREALNIYINEHSPEEQMSESIPAKKDARLWTTLVSFTRGEYGIKLSPEDDPLSQDGFFRDQDGTMLEFREMKNGAQHIYHSTTLAASKSINLALRIKSMLAVQ